MLKKMSVAKLQSYVGILAGMRLVVVVFSELFISESKSQVSIIVLCKYINLLKSFAV